MLVNIKVYPYLYISTNACYLNKKAIRLLNIDIENQYIDFHFVDGKKIAFIYVSNIPGIELKYNANLFKFSSRKKVARIFELYQINQPKYRLIIDEEPILAGDIKYHPLIKINYEQSTY
ncbi:MAG: hypothetical protein QXG16_04935 [Candidatus Anstonellaceae archaeon]